ncbi:MAG: response regulator transcription factor [Firmicutes bacterium]|nr:response regulator transcription factor [Bacillota bacterium]
MNTEGIKVLIVEDEEYIRKFININLKRNGFAVLESGTGEKALEMVEKFKPEIVILDIMLPGMDGFEVCRKIRHNMPEVIIIMLTARGQDLDKITGLELGADDYMVKPFNPLELIARIKSILRRTENNFNNIKNNNLDRIIFKNLVLDNKSQRFFKDEVEIELTPTEFSIVKMFLLNPGKALSRDELLNFVWGRNYFGDLKTVDVYIRRIREKIEDNPSKPKFIETVWGIGYRWQAD